MATFINSVTIENFKSLEKLTLEHCATVNVFIGKPNVGKSSILEALSLLGNPSGDRFFSEVVHYEAMSNLFYDQEVQERIIRVETDYAQCYIKYLSSSDLYWYLVKQNLTFNYEQFKEINTVDDVLNQKIATASIGGTEPPLISQSILNKDGGSQFSGLQRQLSIPVRRYEYHRLLKHNNPFGAYLLMPSGENLVSILQTRSEIRSLIAPLFEQYGLELVMDVSERLLRIQKRRDGLAYSLPYSMVADTLQRMILYIAAIHSNKGAVLLFEEPEAHAFPPYIKMLADYIAIEDNNQYFITTHSPYLLQTLARDTSADIAVFVVDLVEQMTVAKRIEGASLQHLIDEGSSVFFNLERL
jgi:AAA15 family ATPase/GTPase